MLKVIGAGLPRTGTTSMKAALDRLGFGPCYHMFEVMKRPEYLERWLPACSGAPMDWDWIFEGYQSSQDWPSSFFWRELAAAYPEAKVILTVRDPAAWSTSFSWLMAHSPRQAVEQEQLPDGIRPIFDMFERLRPLFERIGRSIFGDDWPWETPNAERMVAAYHRYVAGVREGIPGRRLLVFDVRQGWGPLCDFLGVDIPAGEPFPHLNDAESLRRTFDQMVTQGRLVSPFDAHA